MVAAVTPNNSKWTRCYHAKSDGFTAHDFHSRCDNKGPTVTLVQVREFVFGGFLDQNWGGKLNISIISFFFIRASQSRELPPEWQTSRFFLCKRGWMRAALGIPVHSYSSNEVVLRGQYYCHGQSQKLGRLVDKMKRENNNKLNIVPRVFLFSNMATAGRNFFSATFMKARVWGNPM